MWLPATFISCSLYYFQDQGWNAAVIHPGGKRQIQEAQAKRLSEDASLLPLGTETALSHWKPWLLMAPRWTNGFRWSAEPQSSFQMPPLPCWTKPLIIWAKGYNCWDRDNKCFYQLLHLKPLQFFQDPYLQHCCGWCRCSQVHVSSSDWYKDTKIFVLNQVAELL